MPPLTRHLDHYAAAARGPEGVFADATREFGWTPATPASGRRVAYVLEVYPRFSQTCVVNEILAHERAGVDIHIFSLRAPVEGRFHEMLARVRAGVTSLPCEELTAEGLWAEMGAAA